MATSLGDKTGNVIFAGIDGNKVSVQESELHILSDSMRGSILMPGSPGYEESRRIWNGMFQRKPSAIAFCKETGDVSRVVNFSRKLRILTSIRSGGHNVGGNSLCDGGMTIDLTYMNSVEVDPVGMFADAQGGALLEDVDRTTQLHGLATPLGVVSKTGIAGLTLGGGYGHLRRKYGLTIDNLLSVEIVTADGKILRADSSQNSDLFWAVRGGGGNFGVVTKFRYRLYSVGPVLYQVYTAYSLEEGRDVLKKGRDYLMNGVSAEVSAEFQLAVVPDTMHYPAVMRGKRVVIMRGVHAGDLAEGKKEMEPLRNLGRRLYDSSGPRSYVDIQTYADNTVPNGLRYYSTGIMVRDLDERLAEVLLEEYSSVSLDDVGVTGIWHTGGAISSISPSDTAYSARDNNFMIVIDLGWSRPDQDREQIAWARNLKKRIKALYPEEDETGYINFQPGENEKLEIGAAYGANYTRLSQVKKKYDPDNFFRVNHNIRPS